ncbi:21687_t:CDS:1, partial [Gigaspora margarita]
VGKMDISSDSDCGNQNEGEGEEEARGPSHLNSILWVNKIITIDSRQVFPSFTSTPVVHIGDITNAMPRQFFERFIPVDFIISIVIPSTNRCACECEKGWHDLT